MAVNIGPRIGIEGEAQYRKEIQGLIQQTKTLKSEMQATASAWDKSASSMKKNAETRKNLNQQIDVQKKRVEELKKMLSESEQKYGENSQQTLKWKQAVADATTELNKLNNELKNTPNGLQSLGQDMTAAGDKIKGVGEALAPVSAVAAAGIGASVKLASDFENSMAKVSTIADTGKVPLKDLQQQIMDLSNATGIAAPEIAANVYDAISAGQDTGDAVSFVANATTLAKAGFTSSSSALDILTTAMNAYGMSADEVSHVSDVLITTQNLGKTTVDQLAASMGKVIPTAKSQGVGIEQLSAAYAVMTANGIGTAETTTYLNSMLNELGKSGSSAEKAFRAGTEGIKEGGLTMKEAMESGMSLTDVLAVLQTQAEKNGTTISNMFGSAEAGKAATVLQDNATKVTETIDAMNNSSGATETAFKKLDTTSNQVAITVNRVKNSATELGTSVLTMLAPALETVSTAVSKAAEWFSNLDEDQKKTIGTIGLVVAAAAPVLVVIGSVVSAVGTIVGAIGTFLGVVAPVAGAIGGVVAAAAPFIAIAAGVVAAGVLIYKNWDTIKATAIQLVDTAKQKFEEFKAKISEAFENAKTAATEKFNAIKTTVITTWDNIKTSVTEKVTAVNETITNGITQAKETVTTILDSIKQAFQEKFDAAKDIVSKAIETIKGLFKFEWELPKIKLPHFNITGEFSLVPPKAPHFSVDWYAKAMENGMILKSPTIFGASGGHLLGAGEAGPEVVVGAESLFGMIRRAVGDTNNYGGNTINVYGAPGQDVHELAQEIADIINGEVGSRRAAWA